MAFAPPTILTVGVCISDALALSDFGRPVEILAGIDHVASSSAQGGKLSVPFQVVFDYLAPTLDPVVTSTATLNPTKTYAEVARKGMQYDILWLPAGQKPNMSTGLGSMPPEEIAFIRAQALGAKYILSVCSCAVQLALTGVLGKRATKKNAFHRVITETASTANDIDWMPKARWVVDRNIWINSGVAAGTDMALAFLEHLAGAKLAPQARSLVEIPESYDRLHRHCWAR
ncbi:class I glutamine amidotransferase-like protein [Mycena amicta]|nr:class I glutamine amidotransferase-like protein [Mycena amicta]